jgi:WD repeat-containing protein 81
MVEDSIAKPLFVLYQLLQLLNHCHSKGATLGDLSLKNVFMDARLWVQVRLPLDVGQPCEATPLSGKDKPLTTNSEANLPGVRGERSEVTLDVEEGGSRDGTPNGSIHLSHAGSTNTLTGLGDDPSSSSSSSLSYPSLSLHLSEATYKWRLGELSNFDYLMLLNQHAGRVLGDPNNHPIFPWVMEFTHKDGGYRDLSKSKYRINKGDRQLDFTFLTAQEELRRGQDHESLVPHHIGDISSDVTYYVYLARKTPKEVLCSRVRPQWVPKEYPSSIEKMYIWTPDECIPEFYADPSIFKSIHPDLPDLCVPDWASSPEELIAIHRAVLEGDVVSAGLHHWIDLMFGYKLTGHEAIKAKNVYVSLVDKHKDPQNCGIVQLFKSSHPKRIQMSSAPLALSSWNTYLSMSSVMNATSFPIHQHSSSLRHSMVGGKDATPEPSNQKTLESIIIEQAVNQQNGSSLNEDGLGGDIRNDSLEDDFTGSFEHVNMEEVKGRHHAGTPSPALPSADFGINYEETAPSSELKAPPLSKPRGESFVMPVSSNRFRVPVVNMIFNRQRNKGVPGEAEVGYDWQQEVVSFPKEAMILQRLNKLEDMAHFAFKSCKDDGTLYQEQWEPQDLLAFDVSLSDTYT